MATKAKKKPAKKTKRPAKKLYDFVFICDKTAGTSGSIHDGLMRIMASPAAFKCPGCGLSMLWNAETRKFGAHGRSEKSIGHQLRSVAEQ